MIFNKTNPQNFINEMSEYLKNQIHNDYITSESKL